jgi:hypothetical protein
MALLPPVDPGRPRERTTLDVHVEARDVVARHDCSYADAIAAGPCRNRRSRSPLVGAPPAERWDHVAAERAEGLDVRQVSAGGERLAARTVPRERAGGLAERLEEREREVPRPDCCATVVIASEIQVSK